MRKLLGLLLAAGALFVLALGPAASAGSPNDRVTGGGQVLNVFTDDEGNEIAQTTGAGDTVGFVAQEDGAGGLKGEVQYVDRVSDASGKGTGRGQTVYHYKDITCLIVVGADALVIAENGSDWIELNVTDGGPHADFVLINRGADVDPESEEDDAPECDEAAGDDTVALARGNVTVYDAPDE